VLCLFHIFGLSVLAWSVLSAALSHHAPIPNLNVAPQNQHTMQPHTSMLSNKGAARIGVLPRSVWLFVALGNEERAM
jgi:hypothetical protein